MGAIVQQCLEHRLTVIKQQKNVTIAIISVVLSSLPKRDNFHDKALHGIPYYAPSEPTNKMQQIQQMGLG